MKLTKVRKVNPIGLKYVRVYFIDKKGKKQGKYICYRPNGSKFFKCNYKDDLLHGKYIEYDKNNIKRTEKFFKDERLLKITLYNEKGQKIKEEKYFYP